jgi:hypothetical protein
MKKIKFPILFIALMFILTGFVSFSNRKNKDFTRQASEKHAYFSHPLYVSITQISYNTQSKNVEIAIKVFADDLEKAVSAANNNKALHLNTKQELTNTDVLIQNYLLKSFKLKLNGKAVNLKWIGKEYETDDATWCYFEVPSRQTIKTIAVQNTIFTEIYSKQNNIVQVKTAKGKKSLLLGKDNFEGTLSF